MLRQILEEQKKLSVLLGRQEKRIGAIEQKLEAEPQTKEGGDEVLPPALLRLLKAASELKAWASADELAKNGRKATVIDAYSFPLKTDGILDVAARSSATIISVEDNYSGGLDAELATAIAAREDELQLKSLYVRGIPKSGREPDDVLEYLSLGMKQILQAV